MPPTLQAFVEDQQVSSSSWNQDLWTSSNAWNQDPSWTSSNAWSQNPSSSSNAWGQNPSSSSNAWSQNQQRPAAARPWHCSWHGPGNGARRPLSCGAHTGERIHAKLQSHCAFVEAKLGRCDFLLQQGMVSNFLEQNEKDLIFICSEFPKHSDEHGLWMGVECKVCGAGVFARNLARAYGLVIVPQSKCLSVS